MAGAAQPDAHAPYPSHLGAGDRSEVSGFPLRARALLGSSQGTLRTLPEGLPYAVTPQLETVR